MDALLCFPSLTVPLTIVWRESNRKLNRLDNQSTPKTRLLGSTDFKERFNQTEQQRSAVKLHFIKREFSLKQNWAMHITVSWPQLYSADYKPFKPLSIRIQAAQIHASSGSPVPALNGWGVMSNSGCWCKAVGGKHKCTTLHFRLPFHFNSVVAHTITK